MATVNTRVTSVLLLCSLFGCRDVVHTESRPVPDTDGDGVIDVEDGCPLDAGKIAPGYCGCGIADVDADEDGVLACDDGCESDPDKIAPGECGCGVVDSDTDRDDVFDCNDGCVSDPNKDAPGACGCGAAETDTDIDGTPDCVDLCPADPLKIAAGECGCGTSDADTDADGVLDCNDNCPEDWTEWQWDFDEDGIGDPCDDSDGTAEHPYAISTAAQLNMIGAADAANAFGSAAHRLGSHYVLTADINLSSFTGNSFNLMGTVTHDAAEASATLPGSNPLYQFAGDSFHGELDGNGHVISGLTYAAAGTTKYIGLFRHLGSGPYVCDVLCTSDMQCWTASPFPPGTDPHSVSSGDAEYFCLESPYRSHGRVRNLTLRNFTISAYGAVGAVAGFIIGSRIDNVVIENSTITATSSYATASCKTNAELAHGGGAGGAVGAAYQSDYTTFTVPESRTGISKVAVLDSTVSGSISVGGVVGVLVFSNIERAYVDNVSLSSTNGYVGGIVGHIRYHDNNSISIDNTYADTIAITASGAPAGAILGGAHCEVSAAADVRHSFMVPDPTVCSLSMVGSGGVLTNVACYPSMGALNATFDEDGDGPGAAAPVWDHGTSPPTQNW